METARTRVGSFVGKYLSPAAARTATGQQLGGDNCTGALVRGAPQRAWFKTTQGVIKLATVGTKPQTRGVRCLVTGRGSHGRPHHRCHRGDPRPLPGGNRPPPETRERATLSVVGSRPGPSSQIVGVAAPQFNKFGGPPSPRRAPPWCFWLVCLPCTRPHRREQQAGAPFSSSLHPDLFASFIVQDRS